MKVVILISRQLSGQLEAESQPKAILKQRLSSSANYLNFKPRTLNGILQFAGDNQRGHRYKLFSRKKPTEDIKELRRSNCVLFEFALQRPISGAHGSGW